MAVFLPVFLITGLSFGPEIGAVIPAGENADSWQPSLLMGLVARYELPAFDVDAGFGFSELAMPPDSSYLFDYQLYAVSAGISKDYRGLRLGFGSAVHSIDGHLEVDEQLDLSRSGTEYGGYAQLGREFRLSAGVAGFSVRIGVFDPGVEWLTASFSYLLHVFN